MIDNHENFEPKSSRFIGNVLYSSVKDKTVEILGTSLYYAKSANVFTIATPFGLLNRVCFMWPLDMGQYAGAAISHKLGNIIH